MGYNNVNVTSKHDSCSRWFNIEVDSMSAGVAFMKQAWLPDVKPAPTSSRCYQGKAFDSIPEVGNSHSPRSCYCTVNGCEYDRVNGSNLCDYGFIPLQPLGRFKSISSSCSLNLDYIGMHQLLCQEGKPNCTHSQLVLCGFRDHQLIYFLKYGFPP